MVIYFVLISVMSAQIAVSEGMRRKIAQGTLERKSRSGLKASKTNASEEARRRGHETGVMYLRIGSICGIVGVVVSLALLIMMSFSHVLIAVPLLVLVVQIATTVAALTVAKDAVAKA